jgi:hypothetical protein
MRAQREMVMGMARWPAAGAPLLAVVTLLKNPKT